MVHFSAAFYILDALEQNPELRRQLRQHVLTEELLKLPAIVGEPEDGDGTIVQQLKGLDTRMDGMNTRMDRVDGRTANQEGREYEAWAASQVHDLLWFALVLQPQMMARTVSRP